MNPPGGISRDELVAGLDLVRLAQDYVDRRSAASHLPAVTISGLADLVVLLDEAYCRDVAEYFDHALRLAYNARLARLYDRMQWENRLQYQAILDAGVEIEPWLGPGQPYRSSQELVHRVRGTGTLYVYLTRDGHGPPGGASYHPLREPSGVTAQGVELTHNDVFRAVHDVFGHVMFGNSFGPRGEFKATYCHMHMYPEVVHPILFTEQIGQICWFFFGPHLLDRAGNLPKPGDPGYLPLGQRPYPEQKVFPFDHQYLDIFKRLFHVQES
jgi:hypothetical protein